MTIIVELRLPAEVGASVNLPYEGHRGIGDVAVVINALDVASTVVALATLKPNLEALATSLRSWLARRAGHESYLLTIKGNGLDLRLTLKSSTSKAEILKFLSKLSAAE